MNKHSELINKMKIALIGPLPPPSGGMANQTRQLADLLRQEGIDVEIVQVNAPYIPAWVEKFRGIRSVFRLVPYTFKLWNVAARVDVIHVMANSGWSWHLFSAPAIWLGKFRRTPIVVNYRGGEADTFLKQSVLRAWIIHTMKQADAMVVPSVFLKIIFQKYDVCSCIIANIINLHRFHQSNSKTTDVIHIVVTRNLEEIYDIKTAIEAFEIVKKELKQTVQMTIAGSGPQKEELERLVQTKDLASAVRFTGRLQPVEMAELYQSADMMINPSLVDNMPNSILESLASGVPVVSSDVGGIPYMVKNKHTALLVKPGKPELFARAVISLINEPETRQRLIKNGLGEVSQYEWKNIKPLWLSLYHKTIRNKPL